MNSAGFRIIPINTLEKAVRIGQIFYNSMAHERFAQEYLNKSQLFVLSDHTKKALIYMGEVNNFRLMQLFGHRNLLPLPVHVKEIADVFKKNGIQCDHNPYLKEAENIDPPCLGILNIRNHKLEKILSNFTWIDRLGFCVEFSGEVYLHLHFENERIIISPTASFFSSNILRDHEKALFVEHDIKEKSIQDLQSQLMKLAVSFPKEMKGYTFNYKKGQGLLSYE